MATPLKESPPPSSSPLYALELTYGQIMPRKGFTRVLQRDNTPAPLTLPATFSCAQTAASVSYLWYTRASGGYTNTSSSNWSSGGGGGSSSSSDRPVPISAIRIVSLEEGQELVAGGLGSGLGAGAGAEAGAWEVLPRPIFAMEQARHGIAIKEDGRAGRGRGSDRTDPNPNHNPTPNLNPSPELTRWADLYVCVARDPACTRPVCHLYVELLSGFGGAGAEAGAGDGEWTVEEAGGKTRERVCVIPGVVYLCLERARVRVGEGDEGDSAYAAARPSALPAAGGAAVGGAAAAAAAAAEAAAQAAGRIEDWDVSAEELNSYMDRLEQAASIPSPTPTPTSTSTSTPAPTHPQPPPPTPPPPHVPPAESIWDHRSWLDTYTRRCLASAFKDPSVVPRVNKFLRQVRGGSRVRVRGGWGLG